MTPRLIIDRGRRRLAPEDGWVLLVVLGVMTFVMLLMGSVFLTVQSDAGLGSADTYGKQAYSAAQAGLQAYLYDLNDNSANSQWWQTCANDSGSATVTTTPSDPSSYSYSPVIACAGANAVNTVLDANTGQLRIDFTGTAGPSGHTQTRTIVGAFKTTSPLSFLWYTVHETLNPSISSDNSCANFYDGNPGPNMQDCPIQWISGDTVAGAMYSQDEFYVPSGSSPQFGGSSTDQIESSSPSLCVGYSGTSCGSANIVGHAQASAPLIKLPSDNSQLSTDAGQSGNTTLPNGTTTLVLSGGTTANAVTCTTASSCHTTTNINLKNALIYAPNVPGAGCPGSYSPQNVPSYPAIGSGAYAGDYYGTCGDIYVRGTYSYPLTLSAGNNIVVTGNLENSSDTNGTTMPPVTNTATLGLVADAYVRVAEAASSGGPASQSACYASDPSITIDAAILTLTNSFVVDNYQCGANTQSGLGTLTVHGAIAQYYRGAVGGTTGYNCNQQGNCQTTIYGGFVKSYSYDPRLAYILPPDLFDLQDAAWSVVRETLCSPTLPSSNSQSCQYQS